MFNNHIAETANRRSNNGKRLQETTAECRASARGVLPATTTINNGSGEAQDAGNDFCGKEIFLVFSYSDFL